MVDAEILYYRENSDALLGITGPFMDVVPVTLQFKVNIISGEPSTYLWDFGDGSTSNIKEPVHTYRYHGNYRITLTITDETGDNIPTPVEIHLGKIDFSAETTRGLGPLLVEFVNSSVAPAGSSFTGWIWNFGDGVTGVGANPTHIYSEVGKYSVRLDAMLSIP